MTSVCAIMPQSRAQTAMQISSGSEVNFEKLPKKPTIQFSPLEVFSLTVFSNIFSPAHGADWLIINSTIALIGLFKLKTYHHMSPCQINQ